MVRTDVRRVTVTELVGDGAVHALVPRAPNPRREFFGAAALREHFAPVPRPGFVLKVQIRILATPDQLAVDHAAGHLVDPLPLDLRLKFEKKLKIKENGKKLHALCSYSCLSIM